MHELLHRTSSPTTSDIQPNGREGRAITTPLSSWRCCPTRWARTRARPRYGDMSSASTACWPGSRQSGPPRGAGGDRRRLLREGDRAASGCNAAHAGGGLVRNKRNTSEAALQRSTPPQRDGRGGNDGHGQPSFGSRLALHCSRRRPVVSCFFARQRYLNMEPLHCTGCRSLLIPTGTNAVQQRPALRRLLSRSGESAGTGPSAAFPLRAEQNIQGRV